MNPLHSTDLRIRQLALPALGLALMIGQAGCSKAGKPSDAQPASREPRLFEVPEAQRARLEVVKVETRAISRPLHVPAVVAFNDLKTTDVVPLVSGRMIATPIPCAFASSITPRSFT